MAVSDHALLVQLRRHASGEGDHGRLMTAFVEGTFFCQAPEHPGFLATPARGGPLIAVFTSEEALARYAGACRWFSTTGADLIARAPVGHRFVVDPGSPHQVVIDPAAIIKRASGPAA